MHVTKPYKFRKPWMSPNRVNSMLWAHGCHQAPNQIISFVATYVTEPYTFMGFCAMDVAKPYKFISFGAMDVTKPYKFKRFGAMDVTKPYKICMLWGHVCHQTL